MFDRIINILVIEKDPIERESLVGMLANPGHNVFIAETISEAFELLEDKYFVIIFCSIDFPEIVPVHLLEKIQDFKSAKNSTVIITSNEKDKVYANVGNQDSQITVDYLIKPYLKNLVKAKTDIFKKLYYKQDRVSRLLESILPNQTLLEYRKSGKSSPKKKKNCTVLFTDFVGFTKKTKETDAQTIVQKLDTYFSKFDAIIRKYKLEKIKTIGDAYMVVGGVTEKDPYPAIRTALAAIELRNLVSTEIETNKALGRDYWEMRIGIHCGDLVAGVVGDYKFSFDVWGDTVNMAARCEQNSHPNKITISDNFYKEIKSYFDCTNRGPIEVKYGRFLDMHFLDAIKPEYSLDGEGRTFSINFRQELGMKSADFEGLRTFILTKLKAELSENLLYHSSEHTVKVEKAILKYAELEGLSEHELFLVRTAALFHDSGFLYKYERNEAVGVEIFEYYAPLYGFEAIDISMISAIILSTSYDVSPKNHLEAIMRDADLDYLGRIDYHVTAKKLFDEMALYGKNLSELERIDKQIDYLTNHHTYNTTSAKNLRNPGKIKRIMELNAKRAELIGNEKIT